MKASIALKNPTISGFYINLKNADPFNLWKEKGFIELDSSCTLEQMYDNLSPFFGDKKEINLLGNALVDLILSYSRHRDERLWANMAYAFFTEILYLIGKQGDLSMEVRDRMTDQAMQKTTLF